MSALPAIFWTFVGVCAVVWALSLVTRDYSWVDRIWSLIPVAYLWIFAAHAGLANTRLDLMAVLVTLWGARLTFNFARKGGYSGVEDYRWGVLRGRMSRQLFGLFSLFFITIYQNVILALITFPALTASDHRTPVGAGDVILAALFLAFLTGETVADEQQWRFHVAKRRDTDAGRDPGVGFLRTGLWRFSRHPNFFFEQAQWWTIFLFGAVAAGSILQWTALGAALLTLLFVGSTRFTESITAPKYPAYAEYQATTSAVIPLPPRRAAKISRTA
jgi:steroid 5-alpha reductase family enzyme